MYKVTAITKDMPIGQILREHPDKIQVLMSLGMGCIACPAAQGETLEEAAMVHGLDADELVKELNK